MNIFGELFGFDRDGGLNGAGRAAELDFAAHLLQNTHLC